MRIRTFIFLILINIFVLYPAYSKGLKAPDFSLKDENGKIVKLSNLKGNVVVLVFWSTTCHTCREELPKVSKIAKKYEHKPIKFFAVVIDTDNPEKIRKIKKEWNFNLPVLIADNDIVAKYRIFGTPITYILRKDLTVGKILIGSKYLHKLEIYINRFLASN